MFGLDKKFLEGYKPSFPVSYIYAKDNIYKFYNKKWLDWLDRNNGTHVGVNGGHWIMNNHKDLVAETVRERIKSYKAKL